MFFISSTIECSRFCQSELNLCLVIIVNISKREKMTCMSMYKTTKIVPVKVVRLMDFLVLCPGRSDLLPTACSLVLKQHPMLSVMSRVLYNEEKEQCFTIRFNTIRCVTSESHYRFNSEGKKCFPPCTPSIGLQVKCTSSVASRRLECFSLQRSTTLAMANLTISGIFVHCMVRVWTLSYSVSG